MAKGKWSITAMFVDAFTKQSEFVPCNIKIDATPLARLYLDNIYRHHGLSRCIISDRDPKFTSTFWKSLFTALQTKLNISSACHPQTDGQTKRTHITIDQILRAFIHKQHDSWLSYLALAEFSYNYSVHSTTHYAPFDAIYGMMPLTPPDMIATANQDARNTVANIQDIHMLITEQLKLADEYQKVYADRKTSHVEFAKGDQV